jgi:hypothetical protein
MPVPESSLLRHLLPHRRIERRRSNPSIPKHRSHSYKVKVINPRLRHLLEHQPLHVSDDLRIQDPKLDKVITDHGRDFEGSIAPGRLS